MYEAKFDISDVADLLGIERLTQGNSFNVVCPFCGDKRGKMNFRILKDGQPCNTYRCFHCGEHGNMLTLYAELKGIYGSDRYKISYREILEALGRSDIRKRTNAFPTPTLPTEEKVRKEMDFEARSRVYERLLELLSLTETHKKKLLERGFRAGQVAEFQFRSTPIGGTEGIARKLLAEGYSLEGIPGFFVNGRNHWDAAFYRRNHGILCPVRDIYGRITGFQIRLDQPYDGRKYLWFSTTNKLHGTGSKSPVAFFGKPGDRIIRVTEGVLKANAAYAMSGYSFLGVPGVSQYKELERVLVELKELGLEEVQEYYDMDKYMAVSCDRDYKEVACAECAEAESNPAVCKRKLAKRDQIQEGCRKLYEICRRLGLRCIQKRWDCNEDGTWNGHLKGIDDYWWENLRERREYGIKNEYDREPVSGGNLLPCEASGAGG